jgi:hypothetical protein
MKILEALLNLVRFILFSLLIFIRPVFGAVLGLASGLCLLGFLFCVFFARDQQTPLWAFLGAGIASTMVLWFYDALLSFLAPDGYVMIAER